MPAIPTPNAAQPKFSERLLSPDRAAPTEAKVSAPVTQPTGPPKYFRSEPGGFRPCHATEDGVTLFEWSVTLVRLPTQSYLK